MQKLKLVFSVLVLFTLLFTGCQKDDIYTDEVENGSIHNHVAGERSCASHTYLQNQLALSPERQAALDQIEDHLAMFESSAENRSGTVYTIPVVVHVVYNNAAENISEAQILSQIQVLNDDFRRLNGDANNTWSQAADSEIEFCMATVDPNGNATNGITRTSTNKASFDIDADDIKKSNQGGKNAWDPTKYMNIWVGDIGDGLLGYAQFPGGPVATDGVVIAPIYFGTTGTAQAPFNLGRTGTHEVGHYLNLYHIWGDGACNQDDNVTDTPSSDAANYGCATGHTSCNSTDMVQNYMDYSDDACMNLFTQGQKSRMRALFASGGSRASLVNSNACSGGGTSPTCSDGIQNQGETGVDCGGPCSACTTTPTCSDGVQNGNETGIDCGGSCAPCNTGTQTQIWVLVKPDIYGSEVTWKLYDENWTVLSQGGPYPDNSQQVRGKKVTVDANACLKFVIRDSYGDGMTASSNSWYKVKYVGGTGNIIYGNGNYGTKQRRDFCLSQGILVPGTDQLIESDEPIERSLELTDNK